MGRGQSDVVEGHAPVVNVKAISGSSVVVLAWDVPEQSTREGLLGFAIRKSVNGKSWWLPAGKKRFSEESNYAVHQSGEGKTLHDEALDCITDGEQIPASSEGSSEVARLTTYEVPLQGFSWCDYCCRPGTLCEYFVCPVYADSSSSALTVREDVGASVNIQLESNGPDSRHQIWFNRGVAGSQAYANQFGSSAPKDVAEGKAWEWLSNGLAEAMLDFIGRAEGPGWMLRCAFYEFTWAPALDALAKAVERGVDVRIVVDFGSSAPRSKPEVTTVGSRVDLSVPFSSKDKAKELGAKWDAPNKTWYAPQGEAELLKIWGPRVSTAGCPMAASEAMEAYPALKDVVIPRRNGKAISHNKFIVVIPPDEKSSVWTGSTNLTESGVYGQSNVAHIVNLEPAVVDEYLKYWECLANDMPSNEIAQVNADRIRDDNLPSPSTMQDESCSRPSVQVVMSPRPSLLLLDAYANLLASAHNCACLTAAFGVNKKLASVLEQDTGAERFLLLEKRGNNYDRLTSLSCNHAVCGAVLGTQELDALELNHSFEAEKVTGLNEHVQFVHDKFMLIDPLGSSPMVVTGSANFSEASVQKNDENMLFIAGDTQVADMYFVEFWRLFQHWKFRDFVRQRARERRDAEKNGNEVPPMVKMTLKSDDTWVGVHYSSGSVKCKEREMLMATHIP